ncbi:MAG: hypothetical protein AB1728_14545 [Bacteroidota bacterium]
MAEPPYKIIAQHFSALQGKICLLYGTKEVYSLATSLTAEFLGLSETVVCIDGANRVDPYALSKIARIHLVDPYTYLDRVYVSRAYTCYQLDVSITDGLFDFLRSVGARILLIYGLINLFDDDQVPDMDIVDILRRVRQALVHLKANGISVLLVSSYPHFHLKRREEYFKHMMLMSDVHYRLETDDTSQHTFIEESCNGKNNTDGNHAYPIRAKQLVTIPPRAAERRPADL